MITSPDGRGNPFTILAFIPFIFCQNSKRLQHTAGLKLFKNNICASKKNYKLIVNPNKLVLASSVYLE